MKQHTNYWIGGLIMLGLFFVLITGWSIFTASSGVSSVVDPYYYDHGLKYNNSEVERNAAAVMDWNIDVRVIERLVTINLQKASQDPVSGCRGQLSLHSPKSDIKQVASLELKELSPGIYAVQLPINIAGTVPAELVLGKDNILIRRSILLNIKASN